jgi:hypothetical protein
MGYRLTEWPTDCQPITKIKWADYQEAVTFLWLPAHSILKWIGGDISMLDPSLWMSSFNSELVENKFSAIFSRCTTHMRGGHEPAFRPQLR